MSKYVGVADVSLGLGETKSTFTVAEVDGGKVVLTLTSTTINPSDFADRCFSISHTTFPGMLIAWEDCGPGIAFGRRIAFLGYPNVFVLNNTRLSKTQTAALDLWEKIK